MRCLFLILFPFALLIASCAVKPEETKTSACDTHFLHMQTMKQGISDAKCDIRAKGFRILRYDMPMARTGCVEIYNRPFEHFGIVESDEYCASLDYCRGYNGEMDRQLLKRYGAEYRRLRSEILPAPGAGRYQSSKS